MWVLRSKYLLAVLSAASVAVFYAVVQESTLRILSTDLLFVITSWICTYFATRVLKRWGLWAKFGVLYVGLTLGIALTAVGNIVEIGGELVGLIFPFPSPVDVLDVTGGLMIIIGLLPFLYVLRSNLTRRTILFFSAGGIFAIGSVSLYLLRSVSWSAGLGPADVISLVFPVLGILGVVFSFLLFLALKHTASAKSWFAIALGGLFFSVGNIAYGITTTNGWYYVGHPLEILWNWAYISLSVGFEVERKTLDEYETQP